MDNFENFSRPINLIHSLGGCGGTLLAQCLGVLQDVILLSECNPLSAMLFDNTLNPYVQIKKWYPEIFDAIEDKFKVKDLKRSEKFKKFISAIKLIIDQKNKYLIIRDYNYIDYFGIPFLRRPPLYSNLLKSLQGSFQIKQTILLRHPLHQYNSLRSHSMLKDILNPHIFVKGYHAFLSDFQGREIIKYEDIVSYPAKSISYLSNFFGIPFSADFMKSFHKNQSVTGNFNRLGETQISLSPDKNKNDAWTTELQNHPDYEKLLIKLGY